jgi:hypothetical protein
MSRVAHHEADAPSGHGERLGQGVELDGHVLGPGHLQNRRWLVPVEADVGVGEVVHEHDLVLAGECHQPLHEGEIDAGRRRVVGERQHDDAGFGP